MNSDPRPSMPSRPRQADIDVYNAWARRNGEAPWGARAAPPAAPAPAPAAPGPQSPIAAAVNLCSLILAVWSLILAI